jgi:hypothetical protein
VTWQSLAEEVEEVLAEVVADPVEAALAAWPAEVLEPEPTLVEPDPVFLLALVEPDPLFLLALDSALPPLSPSEVAEAFLVDDFVDFSVDSLPDAPAAVLVLVLLLSVEAAAPSPAADVLLLEEALPDAVAAVLLWVDALVVLWSPAATEAPLLAATFLVEVEALVEAALVEEAFSVEVSSPAATEPPLLPATALVEVEALVEALVEDLVEAALDEAALVEAALDEAALVEAALVDVALVALVFFVEPWLASEAETEPPLLPAATFLVVEELCVDALVEEASDVAAVDAVAEASSVEEEDALPVLL